MISVEEAKRRILAAFSPLAPETVSLIDALGRVLAEDVAARVTQPPLAVSAMDGYAVRAADVAKVPVTLRQIGIAPAGAAFAGTVGAGECVRIFTGGPVPAGADAIVIQEDADADGEHIAIRASAAAGNYVRPAGLDFRAGEIGLKAGRTLSARDVGFAAAMNRPWLKVRRRPRVAIVSTGDEIVLPGDPLGPSQIVSSNGPALAAFVRACGGEPIHLGVVPDSLDAIKAVADGARGADLLVTSGGVSVGEHDLVRPALEARGLTVDFWQIAMRPGKPLMFGSIGPTAVLGLPGNPVSSLVCALIFLAPALAMMLGRADADGWHVTASLGVDLPANDRRQDYLRAALSRDAVGRLVATPFPKQDSSMLSLLAKADCLVIRPPHAPQAKAGTTVDIIEFPHSANVI
ncbi:MAG TPA: gephyrin-like molybdotransferase Glp [Alphaproteobacteria bacterium]|nr:gephyrin-like molybdotransferase Glp [Alphaproteobacteria bacterium]